MNYITSLVFCTTFSLPEFVKSDISRGTAITITNYGSKNAFTSRAHPGIVAEISDGSVFFVWLYNSVETIANYDNKTTSGKHVCITDNTLEKYVTLEPCDATNRGQIWNFAKQKKNGTFTIKNLRSKRCLNNNQDTIIVERKVCIHEDDGPNIYQKWRVEPYV
ncbi:hypothetical protein Fcan01_00520 [Folsomia candida]|uniref:Ricin B lectin domain-containing protein n=1 Tax=Folsomia candida TaxID=158441 RepID=A0A226F0X7_FOLCA|nr:hypothetical protein Fcan01_00520 [Folsomia candida]